jgi:hypothetical protein
LWGKNEIVVNIYHEIVIKDDNVVVKNVHHIKKYLSESIMKIIFHNTIITDLYTVCLP